jgi:hypothetical protein
MDDNAYRFYDYKNLISYIFIFRVILTIYDLLNGRASQSVIS